MSKFEIYQDKRGEWRWRLKAGNGETVAVSEEGFSSKSNVVKTVETVKRCAKEADTVEAEN